jgi:hypothetical protein
MDEETRRRRKSKVVGITGNYFGLAPRDISTIGFDLF